MSARLKVNVKGTGRPLPTKSPLTVLPFNWPAMLRSGSTLLAAAPVDEVAALRRLLLRVSGFQHLACRVAHVFDHLALVVAESHFDVQDRDAPGIDDVLVEADVIFITRQAFTETAQADAPRVILAHHLFQAGAEAGHAFGVLPQRLAGAALKAVTANELAVLRRQVAEARNINAVGAPVLRELFGIDHRHAPRGAAAADMIHQVMAKHARTVSDAVRVLRRHRV